MPDAATAETFPAWFSKSQEDHATDADGVFRRFPEGMALATAPADAARLSNLIVHVCGEHLGRYDEGIALLDRLAGMSSVDPTSLEGKVILRSKAILHLAAGRTAEADRLEAASRNASFPAASNRIRVLATAATMLDGQKRTREAIEALDEALGLAAYGPTKDDPAARALAVTGNNLAQTLEERQNRTPAETACMVRAAEAGLRFWSIAGGWMETERAHYRYSSSLRKAGDGKAAIEQARRGLAVIEANGNDAGEAFYAREALALAHHAAGDAASAGLEREAAAAVLASIADEGFRSMATDSLAALDKTLRTPAS